MSDPIPYPTLLRYPTWYGGMPDEMVLPLEPTAYLVEQVDPTGGL
ncbi:hypothetical protein ACN9MJ_13425 [Acidovorax facilis]